ncbi:hypothetical protein EVAR_26001_1 [Eumeta japonica]|uniref:Uncharacterized protein n=1 Tax=Eumeta variegata TaxID=151549 RepID=A0A4C1V289_EUMVA|nr:hypothetical protein EVAR_26001_1 [Eumeta japonica]
MFVPALVRVHVKWRLSQFTALGADPRLGTDFDSVSIRVLDPDSDSRTDSFPVKLFEGNSHAWIPNATYRHATQMPPHTLQPSVIIRTHLVHPAP